MDRFKALDPYLNRLRELPFIEDARVVEKTPAVTTSALLGRYEGDAAILVKTLCSQQRCLVDHKLTHLSTEAAMRLVTLRRAVPKLMGIGNPTRHPPWRGSAPVSGSPLTRSTRSREHWRDLLGTPRLGFGVRRLGPPCRVLKHTAPQRKPAAGSIPGPTGQRFSIGTS